MSSAPNLPGFPQPEPAPFEPWVAFPVRALFDPQITDLDRRILALLVHYTGRRVDFTCSANLEIAEALGIEKGSVRRSLQRLEAAGYLQRSRPRGTHAARRRIDLAFRTWDPPKDPPKETNRKAPGPVPEVGASAHCTNGRRALAPTEVGASAYQSERQRLPLFHIVSSKEEKSSKGDGAPAQGEKTAGEVTPQTSEEKKVAPRDEAPQDEPTPEQVAAWHQWIREGQPVLVRIARASLAEAGLPVPDPPTPPAQPVPPDAAEPDRERQETQPAAPEAALAAQDRPGHAPTTRDGESHQETAPTQSEPRQAGPPRSAPRGALPELPAANWAALMARTTQLGSTPMRGKTLVGEALLRTWAQSGEPHLLEAVLDSWSAHWRDWKSESRAHWKGCVEQIRTGIVSVEEVLSIVADAERREVSKRAHYFSHHIGDVLRQRRAAKTAPPAKS